MPQHSARTEMLNELIARDRAISRRLFLGDLLSNISSDGSSDSSRSSPPPIPLSPVASRAGTPLSIDSYNISSDIFISNIVPSVVLFDIILSDTALSDISVRLDGGDAPLDPPNSPSTSDTESEDSVSDFELEYYLDWRQHFCELFHTITTTRVLQPSVPIPKSSQLHLLDHWREHSPERFRRKLRVDPTTFDSLVVLIQDNSIFSNNSNCSQVPVHVQLAVFLFRAGHYGNAASPEDIAQWVGLSVGTVKNCTDRVVIALLSLHDDAIHFPNVDEKEDTKNYVESHTCPEWRDGFLLVDGTKFAFFQRPGLHGDTWFDKDGEYSISCQVRCCCLLSNRCSHRILLACYAATQSHDR